MDITFEQMSRQTVEVADLATTYASEYPSLLRLAIALTGRRELAEELVQDTFVAAQRNWSRIEKYDNAPMWLRRVLLNRCVSRHRRAGTEARLLLRLRSEREPSSNALADDLLWGLVRSLPNHQRRSVALFYIDDLPVSEIAVVLGCGEETVRTHLRRARGRPCHPANQPTPCMR
jgi:RNA polymerase sigma factor (sigma-70 family)